MRFDIVSSALCSRRARCWFSRWKQSAAVSLSFRGGSVRVWLLSRLAVPFGTVGVFAAFLACVWASFVRSSSFCFSRSPILIWWAWEHSIRSFSLDRSLTQLCCRVSLISSSCRWRDWSSLFRFSPSFFRTSFCFSERQNLQMLITPHSDLEASL